MLRHSTAILGYPQGTIFIVVQLWQMQIGIYGSSVGGNRQRRRWWKVDGWRRWYGAFGINAESGGGVSQRVRLIRTRTTMAGWHCSSHNTSPSKLSYFFDKPILACVLQEKHIHQSDRLEKCQAPSLSTICHSSLA
ncbi:Uncharacterized protein Fot_36261 [Forsythia ovata]|uniref:Uncharacterized protein n=1 Tax=Forsythia ovata TaxID=205694 RepID=A0ABD1SNX5_9LAMI